MRAASSAANKNNDSLAQFEENVQDGNHLKTLDIQQELYMPQTLVANVEDDVFKTPNLVYSEVEAVYKPAGLVDSEVDVYKPANIVEGDVEDVYKSPNLVESEVEDIYKPADLVESEVPHSAVELCQPDSEKSQVNSDSHNSDKPAFHKQAAPECQSDQLKLLAGKSSKTSMLPKFESKKRPIMTVKSQTSKTSPKHAKITRFVSPRLSTKPKRSPALSQVSGRLAKACPTPMELFRYEPVAGTSQSSEGESSTLRPRRTPKSNRQLGNLKF